MSNNPVLQAAALNSGDGDVFGWVQGWRFAIADYLWHERWEEVDDFLPALSGPQDDAWEYGELLALDPSTADLRYALRILDRYREWVRIAGKDY